MSSPLHTAYSQTDPQDEFESSTHHDDNEYSDNSDRVRGLSRSPHPYAFKRIDTDERSTRPGSPEPGTSSYPSPMGSSDKLSFLDKRIRPQLKRIRTGGSIGLSTPGESGTEADDEGFGYGLVKALPPAPLRPHKGLRYTGTDGQNERRGSDGSGANTSAWLTPSQLVEDDKRARQDYFTRGVQSTRQGGVRGRSAQRSADEAQASIRRVQEKRRAELIRRGVEKVLLGVIANSVLNQDIVQGQLGPWQRERLVWTAVMWTLFLIYPVRLVYYGLRHGSEKSRGLLGAIQVPVTFDPAPLLYPGSIPVLVAASLSSSSTAYLLPNIVLGLAALPRQIIPWSYASGISNMSHWLISIIPLILSEHTDLLKSLSPAVPYKLKAPVNDCLSSETIACLYALHHALVPPLQFVTSTSLLPAELQLLSVALINLLVFSKSPQAVILQTMLWFGGVGLFIAGGPIVRWGIALARIPKWRLRRAGRIIGARQTFISTLAEGLKSRDGQTRKHPETDTEDEDETLPNPAQSHLEKLRIQFLGALKTNLLSPGETETHSAVEANGTAHDLPDPKQDQTLRRRRNTMSSFTLKVPEETQPPNNKLRPKKTKSSTIRFFLSLTPEQATLRKWYYAGYIYALAVILILGPIRMLISRYALNGHEPFGWAISYLFGNVPSIRFAVVNWNLERWIPLPPLFDPTDQVPRFTDQFPNLFQNFLDNLLDYLNFLPGPATARLLLTAYCGIIVAIGILTVLCLSPFIEVDTRRKVFHFTMVALLLPAIAIDPCFISLALGLVLAIFLILELLRASQLPPLSKPIAAFLAPYVDGRDLRGPVVVSHIFLLIGCAIPLWLSMAGVQRTPSDDPNDPWKGWATQERNLSMLSGVICVGLGDAFASLVGRRFGRHKWPWAGGKSLEGSAAFACAVVGGLYLGKALLNVVLHGRIIVSSGRGPFVTASKAALAGAGASLMEAVLTGGNDNVIVPVMLWLLVRAMGV